MTPSELVSAFDQLSKEEPRLEICKVGSGEAAVYCLGPENEHPRAATRFRDLSLAAVRALGLEQSGKPTPVFLKYVATSVPHLHKPQPTGWVQQFAITQRKFRGEPLPILVDAAQAASAVIQQMLDAPTKLPSGLKKSEWMVLRTMAGIGPERLLTIADVLEAMCGRDRVGETATKRAVAQLVKLNYAERPQGRQGGARLTRSGRKVAQDHPDLIP